MWEKFPAWSPYQYGYNNPLTVTDPSGKQGVPIDDEDEVDPYWEGGGGAGAGGGGGSMDVREFFTRAWNAIFSTTKSTPGGTGSGPAATPNRSENPDLLPAASSKSTAIPENYLGTHNSSSARSTATSSAPKGGNSVFEIAKAGGKRSGFYRNYVGRSADEINKAINTLQTGERGINTHLDKMANPSKYVPSWNTLRPEHQQSLIKGWQKEITNAQEQIQILRGILGQ